MNGRLSETLRVNKTFFIIFELIFLGIGIWMLYSGITTKDKGIEISATIDRIDVTTERVRRNGKYRTETDYDVYIDYEFEGKQYDDVSYNYHDSSMTEGKEINIKVDEDDPTKIYYSSQYMLMGGLFVGMSVVMIIITIVAFKNSGNRLESEY